jgi:parallel beta-helix repeat protein
MFTILALFIMSSAAWATTYYVDKNYPGAKDSNPGKESQPWLTIQKAADVATAGDTVYVKKGIYNEWVGVKNSGTAGNPITFKAYPGDRPVIDGTGLDVPNWKALFYSRNKDYITIDGFEVRNSDEVLIRLSYGDNFIIRNCVAHGNSDNGGPTHRSGIIIDHGSNSLVEYNEVHNAGWNGIDAESTSNCMFRYNYLHDNPNHNGINIFPKTSEAQIMYSGNDIMYNTMTSCTNGIYTRYQQNNKIVGNVIYKNMREGIRFCKHDHGPSTYAAYTKIYNNTVVDNGNNGLLNKYATHLTIKNNIFAYNSNNSIYFLKTTGHNINYNLYYSSAKFKWGGTICNSLSSFQKASHQEAKGLDKNPYFAGGSSDDYSLASNSNAIDKGTDLTSEGVMEDKIGVSRPKGIAFDIGAFEFVGDGHNLLSSPRNLQVVDYK